jgi:hypothetical protein
MEFAMPGFSNVSLVSRFSLYARVAWQRVAQASRSVSAYVRRTSARRLLAVSMYALFLGSASLMLMGFESCNEEQQVSNSMGRLLDDYGPKKPAENLQPAPSSATIGHPRLTGTDGSQTGTAGFQGNFTSIQEPPEGSFLLVRQADCSLTFLSVPSDTDPGTATPHYEKILHQRASLKTTPNVFAKGCAETSTGISARPGIFVGATTTNVLVFAAVAQSGGNNAVFLYNSHNGVTSTIDTSLSAATALATADLNGDGNNDLVVVNGNNATSASVSVLLGNADGTFQTAVTYPTAGSFSASAVIDDVNGDGHPDIVSISGGATAQQISVLLGNGDGTFKAAQSFAAPALPGPAQPTATPIVTLITADVNGDGKKDLIGSNGLVLLGKGDGTFTVASAPAFPYVQALSDEGPNLAAGDLNNDGKLDLVVNNGLTVSAWIGNGDGTFTAGKSYAVIEDSGFVTITDIDGDGNADVYVGLADNGIYSGDDSSATTAYALMGNGDGSFQGAPLAPGSYTGNNLVDLNGDGIPDLVSNASGIYGTQNISGTFSIALGTANGLYTPTSTVAPPDTFTFNGYKFTGVASAAASSFALADVNGDSKPDLVFVDNGLNAINPGSGFAVSYPYPIYFVALGNGDGTFQTPVPYTFPQIAPASGFDNQLTVTSLEIADFNKDGHADLVFTYNDLAGGTGVNPYLQGLVVLTGSGTGTFNTTPILTSTYSGATAPGTGNSTQITNVADLNNDGVPDVVELVPNFSVANGATTQVTIFLANGDGTFQAPTAINLSANAYGIPALADFNKDGKPDLALLAETSSGQAEFAIALGSGNGAFATPAISNLTGGDAIRSSSLAAADFNGDGNVDLALIDNNDFSGIFYGKGDGTFTSVPESGYLAPKDLIYTIGGAPAIALDLNKDGKPDIFAGNAVLINGPVPAVTTPPTTTATTTTLTASAASVTVGTSVTLTATVAGASGGPPTGTVTFMEGTTALGTGTLASGVATYATSSLATGSNSITAQYGGDANFTSSTSSAVTVTVSAVPPSFAFSASPATLSVTAGQSGTSTLTITPAGGFSQQVSFACSGLPAKAACSFSPSTITPGASAVTTTLTLSTTAATTSTVPARTGFTLAAGMATLLLFLLPATRVRHTRWLGLVLVLALGGFLTACGGGSNSSSGGGGGGTTTTPGTPAGTSTVTVSATSGSLSQTGTITLMVQ